MKESAVSKEIKAKRMVTSSTVKTVAARGRDQRVSKEGKTAELPRCRREQSMHASSNVPERSYCP